VVKYLTVGIAGAYVRFATKFKLEQGEDGVGKVNKAFTIVLFFGAIIGIIAGVIILILLFTNIIPLNGYTLEEKKLIYVLFIIGVVHLGFSFITMFFNAFNTYKNNFILVDVYPIF